MQLTYLEQPWAMAAAVGIGAFLVGLLIPRKGGSSWFGTLVFFLPNLLLDLLDMVHTKKFKYYGLILALLCIEAFFAARASVVYYDVLGPHMSPIEIALVCALVFVSVGLCGYMVATHGKPSVWSVITAIFVILHDWSGTVYMNYAPVANNTTSATTNDQLTVLITIGMCGLSILPFIMGRWVEQLYPELEKEMEEEVDKFTSTATRKIKRRAVDRVLRLANHTNVVHLVRALPADEFADFKAFVMPIIAPGLSHNLPENGTTESGQSDTFLGDKQGDKTRQNEVTNQEDFVTSPEDILSLVSQDNMSPFEDDTNTSDEMSAIMPKSVTRDAKERDTEPLRATQAKRQRTARQAAPKEDLTAKLVAYQARHPSQTLDQVAKHFGVSKRTIQRRLTVTA